MTESNHRWLMRRLAIATTWEEFEQIVIDIRCDQFESEDWTSDETKSSQLRSYFLHRCRLLGIDPASFKETEE